ncbi:MAG: iron-containing alcohol dehydrogenase [Sphaerochaeta sp.]
MVSNFTYYTPTEVVFGKDTEHAAGALVKRYGGTKVLLHYGSQSAKASGLLDRVEASLKAEGIDYVELGGVVPNPRLSLVHEGIALGKREGVDFILAVGGGSALDSAKAIAYGLHDGGEVWDFYAGKRTVPGALPHAVILTIAAAGSEMSDSSVITNEDGWLKRGVSTPFGRCKFAIMNPELLYTLPVYQTMSGIVDMMLHTMERYFIQEPSMSLTDDLATSLLKNIIKHAPTLLEDPKNYEARANIMWAGSLAHNGLTSAGNGSGGDWACHQLEHELGGLYDVAHGAGLSAVWDSWATYVYPNRPERFASFGYEVFDLAPSGDVDSDAKAAIAAMKEFFESINMPTTIKALGVDPTEEEILEMAKKCTRGGTHVPGSIKALDRADIEAIYRLALGN